MIELTRDLKQYRDVETFEEYELTSCIAYEMAIRNNIVIQYLPLFLEEYVNEDIQNNHFIFDTSQMNVFVDELLNAGINPFQLHLKYHFFEELNIKIKIAMDEIEEYYGNDSAEFRSFTRLFFKKENYENLRTPDHDKKIADLIGEKYPDKDSWSHYAITPRYSTLTIYTEEKTAKGVIKSLEKHEIVPLYKRPELHISKDISQDVNINLNLALPVKELIDFISKVKSEFDDGRVKSKTPLELIGDELIKSGFRRKNGLTPSDWADALFIYDYWKLHNEYKLKGEIISDYTATKKLDSGLRWGLPKWYN